MSGIRPNSDGVVTIIKGGIKKTFVIKDWDLCYINPLVPIISKPIPIDYNFKPSYVITPLSEKDVRTLEKNAMVKWENDKNN